MDEFPLKVGQELAISVFLDNESVGAVILKRTHKSMVECDVYCNNDEERVFLMRALDHGRQTLQATFVKDDLRKKIEQRIHEMIDEDREGRDGYPPSPADDEIPF